ncbi:N-ethylmaleimide reductase [Rhodobacter viridis]|uniref:N-ethylmaleimide reductase n=1 Tax=Rhodobacter viridis TaxID=1054202 RepID=A0A318U652_9RHOB|nr:alkene reductase [Rhodobacter viridis]PYF12873.1 N-ethylmaleimide reductase [Rhodobacter viridis]
MTDTLFSPGKLGDISIANRVVMAPLTRNRAPDRMPTDLTVEYYRQRATAGLIVTEGAQISPVAQGYAWTPGIHTEAQAAAWAKVTEAVHAEGGKIVIQLWHVGRVSHASIIDGVTPVAPSAISAASKTFDGTGFVETGMPREMTEEDIERTFLDYGHAAQLAKQAGFDGVEVHAANGYLIDQFLRDTANKRTDAWGGPIANRIRFLAGAIDACVAVWGPGRVGVRLSPYSNANNVGLDSDTPALFGAAIAALNDRPLAYVHMVEGQTGGPRDWPAGELEALREAIRAPYIANNGYDRASALAAVAGGQAAAIAFGKPFIANPDLVARLDRDAEWNPLRLALMYGGGAEGYTDYPFLA